MAIAPLPDIEGLEAPWPRPVLRLVEPCAPEPFVEISSVRGAPTTIEPERHDGRGPSRGFEHRVTAPRAPELSASRASRAPRTSARVRRHRLALGVLVVGLLVALALPLGVLGGRPVSAAPAPTGGAQAQGQVYVVQPGDTLWSIASQVDGTGNPRPLAEALSKELGSNTVVPGEHIDIP